MTYQPSTNPVYRTQRKDIAKKGKSISNLIHHVRFSAPPVFKMPEHMGLFVVTVSSLKQ